MKAENPIQRVVLYLLALRRDARRYRALVDAAHAHITGKPLTPQQQAVSNAIKCLGNRTGIEDLGRAIDAAIATRENTP